MPLKQYFGWVGGFLLAALIAANWCFPAPAGPATSDIPLDRKIAIRIHTDHKWPERIVFDTTRAMPAQSAAPQTDEEPAGSTPSAKTPLDALAEMTAVPFDAHWPVIFPSRSHKPRGKS